MRKNGIRNTYLELTYKFTSVGVAAPPNEYNLIEHNRLSDFSISPVSILDDTDCNRSVNNVHISVFESYFIGTTVKSVNEL